MGVIDINNNGPLFSWVIRELMSVLLKKLDRIMVNDQWMSDFSDVRSKFDPPDFFKLMC